MRLFFLFVIFSITCFGYILGYENLNSFTPPEKKWHMLKDMIKFDLYAYELILKDRNPNDNDYAYLKGRYESYFYIYDAMLHFDFETPLIPND